MGHGVIMHNSERRITPYLVRLYADRCKPPRDVWMIACDWWCDVTLWSRDFLRHPRGSRTSRVGCKWCFKGRPNLPLGVPNLPRIFVSQDLLQHPQILLLVNFFNWVCYKNVYFNFEDNQSPFQTYCICLAKIKVKPLSDRSYPN